MKDTQIILLICAITIGLTLMAMIGIVFYLTKKDGINIRKHKELKSAVILYSLGLMCCICWITSIVLELINPK